MNEATIAVTAATGHLGRLVVDALLERGVEPGRIVATTRDVERGADMAARGVQVREADYGAPESLERALEGVERLLLVSASEIGKHRIGLHENAVRAAERAGVRLLAYTSIVNADRNGILIAEDHKATEAIIRSSSLPYAMLRNSWYYENYVVTIKQAAEHGVILGSAGEGRVSGAARADYAAAAAAVLTGQGHENSIHELGGDTSFTMSEMAAEVARQSGREVIYRDLPMEAYAEALAGFGLPAEYARVLANADLGIARGELATDSGDLGRLIGRPTMTLAEAVAAAL